MSTSYLMPTCQSITAILEMVFGSGLSVQEGAAPGAAECFAATYVNREDNLVALCLCDLPFVAYSGASLSMIPAGVAKEMIASRDLSKAFVDNFHEVMNICSKLMMSDHSAHLRLMKTLSPVESGGAITSLAENQSCSFVVDIPQYGQGALTFLIAA